MDIEKLKVCSEVLTDLASHFNNIPENKREAVQAALYCEMARSYAVEFAKHLADGMEPYDACVATVKGTIEIPASAGTVLTILTAKPKE